ncbi:rho GDP-dissociation inhibitor 1-like [Mangifera indica]|uniref:rho GDP-dissociation inhibitor 1-like n=1 Tax=Mangifera indica TaxID=29780 RepID=UPI001CF97DA2|nr:rho GDP-dissociation inhibitor 1-like [Mangifera indica]
MTVSFFLRNNFLSITNPSLSCFLLLFLAVGVDSISSNMGFDDKSNESGGGEVSGETETKTPPNEQVDDEPGSGAISRHMSESSIIATEDEDEEDRKIELGPQCTLKQQLEKDKDDESLRRWKEQLLGSVDIDSVGETLEPEVKILSLSIKSPGRPDIVLAVPEDGKVKGSWFTLKEGSRYSLEFTFQVSNNIVSGLKYTNTVWKTGVKVDSTKEMLGTFSPQVETYIHEMPEETTPSGMFARGSYSAKTKFVDDDNKCHLEINYTFDIRKEWQETHEV